MRHKHKHLYTVHTQAYCTLRRTAFEKKKKAEFIHYYSCHTQLPPSPPSLHTLPLGTKLQVRSCFFCPTSPKPPHSLLPITFFSTLSPHVFTALYSPALPLSYSPAPPCPNLSSHPTLTPRYPDLPSPSQAPPCPAPITYLYTRTLAGRR